MNNSIFYFFHGLAFQNQWLDTLSIFLAEPFIYIVIVIVMFLLLRKYKVFEGDFNIKIMWGKGRNILLIVASTVISYFLANLLKIIVHTDRPIIALSNISTLIVENGHAFPSGHSATIAAFAFAVYFRNKKLGYVCLIAALLIGIARIVVGVHFPIDIIGGYVLGFIVAYFLKTR